MGHIMGGTVELFFQSTKATKFIPEVDSPGPKAHHKILNKRHPDKFTDFVSAVDTIDRTLWQGLELCLAPGDGGLALRGRGWSFVSPRGMGDWFRQPDAF